MGLYDLRDSYLNIEIIITVMSTQSRKTETELIGLYKYFCSNPSKTL